MEPSSVFRRMYSLHCNSGVCRRPATRTNVVDTPVRPSNCIMINEPDQQHIMATGGPHQSSVPTSVTGKGKTKLDEILVSTGSIVLIVLYLYPLFFY